MEPASTFTTAIDEATVKRAQKGDMNAIASIYKVLAKPCYNLALRIAGSSAVAEDIVHDTFIKVIGKISRFRGQAPLWAWVRQITVNTTINHLNRRKWLLPLPEDGVEQLPEPTPVQLPAMQHDALTLLKQLSPQARAVLLLHDLEGLTHREIGTLFGQTESFSKSVLFRARQRLQTFINGNDAGNHQETDQ